MDIRQAVAKIEELQRLVHLQKKDAPQSTVIYNIPHFSQFNGSYTVTRKFECLCACDVAIDITIELDNPQSDSCLIAAYIDGVKADSKEIYTGAKGQYSASFLASLGAGLHTVNAETDCGTGNTGTVSGVCIKLCGSVKCAGSSEKITVCRENNFSYAAYDDGSYVYYCRISGQDLIPSAKYIKRGDYAFCECRQDGGYDSLYFYTDGGKLFMLAIPLQSSFDAFREVIDSGVTSIAAEACPLGSMLYYLKGGNVYAVNIRREKGTLLPCRLGVAASSPAALKITAVEDAAGACCFVLNNKNGQNMLYIYGGGFAFTGGESITAAVTAIIGE